MKTELKEKAWELRRKIIQDLLDQGILQYKISVATEKELSDMYKKIKITKEEFFKWLDRLKAEDQLLINFGD